MNANSTGVFAFPRASATVSTFVDGHEDHETHPGHNGMTLRQWYAGQALAGVLLARATSGLDSSQESIAEECFELADALLEKGGAE